MELEELDCFGHYEKDNAECINCDDSELCKNADEDIKEDEQCKSPIIEDTTYTKTPWDKNVGMLAKDKNPPWWFYVICIVFPLTWPFLIFKIIRGGYRKLKD